MCCTRPTPTGGHDRVHGAHRREAGVENGIVFVAEAPLHEGTQRERKPKAQRDETADEENSEQTEG